jgi:CheY-like chemotaxis protein
MPGDDGLMLLEKLKTAQPQLPVVVMSAYTDVASTAGAFRGGAHEFLSKPFDLDDAVALAERTLGRAADAGPAGETPHAAAAAGADALQLVGESPAMRQVFRAIGRLALAPLSVLVTGETGTGKELVARALHRESPRAKRPFVALNTAAIPSELLESELFGHEAGAFTGAQRRHVGRFEQAHGGTLFLDEIGDMPLPLQTRLLRVLAEGEFFRVGGRELISVDVRVLAATHQDLDALVAAGGSAPTCCTGWTWCACTCHRCASAATTCSAWPTVSWHWPHANSTPRPSAWPPPRAHACPRTRGRATCASWRTCAGGWRHWRRARRSRRPTSMPRSAAAAMRARTVDARLGAGARALDPPPAGGRRRRPARRSARTLRPDRAGSRAGRKRRPPRRGGTPAGPGPQHADPQAGPATQTLNLHDDGFTRQPPHAGYVLKPVRRKERPHASASSSCLPSPVPASRAALRPPLATCAPSDPLPPMSTGADRAQAILAPASGSLVSGTLALVPMGDGVHLTGELGGFRPGSSHGFHIHETGDCSAADASSAGGHFNPTGAEHGRAGAARTTSATWTTSSPTPGPRAGERARARGFARDRAQQRRRRTRDGGARGPRRLPQPARRQRRRARGLRRDPGALSAHSRTRGIGPPAGAAQAATRRANPTGQGRGWRRSCTGMTARPSFLGAGKR